jgi:hypothetical protein
VPHFDLLILPLIGGFVFVSKFYPTKYLTLRSDGYRLVFLASLAGAISLFASSLLVYLLGPKWIFPTIYEHWMKIVPVQHSDEAALSLLLGLSLWYPANGLGHCIKYFTDAASIDRAIQSRSDPLEMMLRSALGSRIMISTTLSNRKVYIGYLKSNFNPAYAMESISMFLYYSGHRDPTTNNLTLDVDYQITHAEYKKKINARFVEEIVKLRKDYVDAPIDELVSKVDALLEKEKELLNYEIAIPVREIITVNFFDMHLYNRYFMPIPSDNQNVPD